MKVAICTLFVLLIVVVHSFGAPRAMKGHVKRKDVISSRGMPLAPTLPGLRMNRAQRLGILRGGFVDSSAFANKALDIVASSPASLYNTCLLTLACTVGTWRALDSINTQPSKQQTDGKPDEMKALQLRFLAVFWLIRMADWLQGPYFFELFSTKSFGGIRTTADLVSKIFLVGFVTTGALGPIVGRLVDSCGRKKGTLAFTLLYAISALSTRSNNVYMVLLGRVAGGLGTSLLFSAPEAWLIAEHNRGKFDGKWLGETFGWAFAGDSLVAILAGQLAGVAARRAGPTGPFVLSIAFLLAGAAVVMSQWRENVSKESVTTVQQPIAAKPLVKKSASGTLWDVASKSDKGKDTKTADVVEEAVAQPGVQEAVRVMLSDRRILLVGAVQALFEGAMYIFVLQWAPLLKRAIQTSQFGASAVVPYGSIFSCFMASCLVGSTLFSALQKRGTKVEKSAAYMLMTAAAALTSAALLGTNHLLPLSMTLFAFEACVGMYFPSISTLRSKYLPDRHRSVLMNLFGIPLNLIVVSVFLSLRRLGTEGALYFASAALGIATTCMTLMHNLSEAEAKANR